MEDRIMSLKGLNKEENVRYFLSRGQGTPEQKNVQIQVYSMYTSILLLLYGYEVNRNPCPIEQLKGMISQWLYCECVRSEKFYNRYVLFVGIPEAELVLSRLQAAEYIQTDKPDSTTFVQLSDKGREACRTFLVNGAE